MAIYNATTREPIESPDMSAGYLIDGTIITGYTTEVMPGTVTHSRPGGIKHRVPVTEPCQWYYPNEAEQETGTSEKNVDQKITDAVTAAVALAQGGM